MESRAREEGYPGRPNKGQRRGSDGGKRWSGGIRGGKIGGLLTGEADVDDEGAALVGAVGGPGDGAGEVGDVGAVMERDGDARHLPVAIALGELLLHARDVHHPRSIPPSFVAAPPSPPGSALRSGAMGWEECGRVGVGGSGSGSATATLLIIRPIVLNYSGIIVIYNHPLD